MLDKLSSKLMRSKFLLKLLLLIIVIVVMAVYSYINFFTPTRQNPIESSPVQSKLSSVENPGPAVQKTLTAIKENPKLLIRLRIPKIDVDAAIESVGLTPKGAMDVPINSANVAWFNLGPLPGDIGSAVIAGHYGPWRNRKTSVFDNLNKLSMGDILLIDDEKGNTVSFVVKEIRKYAPDGEASAVFTSNDGKAHLNLITCDGEWDKVSKSYPQRLVIFSEKEE